MDKTTIYYDKKVKFKDPIMVVGLPGIGNVGNLVGDHLKKELKAKKFATLYSPYFPYHVISQKNGVIRFISNRFYYFNTPKNTVIILLGDAQAVDSKGQYEVNEKIVRFFKKLGGKEIYTIGGYSITNHYNQKPKVFGSANDQSVITGLKTKNIIVEKMAGPIIGSAGLLLAFAKKYDIKGACIMGETGFLEIDANAAKAVLEVMASLLGININLKNLDKLKRETDKILKEIESSQQGFAETPPPKDNLSYIR